VSQSLARYSNILEIVGDILKVRVPAPVGGEGGVAFWAHVGGFVAGMALVFVFKRRDVGIWQPPHSRAFETERPRGPWG
jgi:hypothetical protein